MGTKAVAKPLRAAQSGSEPEKIGLAPEPEPFHQLSRWSRAVSGPSRAVTTLFETVGKLQVINDQLEAKKPLSRQRNAVELATLCSTYADLTTTTTTLEPVWSGYLSYLSYLSMRMMCSCRR